MVVRARSRGGRRVADGVWRSSGLLADGREIIYFDESPERGRADVRDGRDLPPSAGSAAPAAGGRDSGHDGAGWAGAGPEAGLRLDPLLGEWVMFATGRRDRPILPPPQACPLCPSRPGRRTEIPAPGATFGEVYRDVLARLDVLYGGPMPYMAAWQQAPVRGPAARAEFALHLQVIPAGRGRGEVKFLAGTESAAGVWSNDTLPELAARSLRQAADQAASRPS